MTCDCGNPVFYKPCAVPSASSTTAGAIKLLASFLSTVTGIPWYERYSVESEPDCQFGVIDIQSVTRSGKRDNVASDIFGDHVCTQFDISWQFNLTLLVQGQQKVDYNGEEFTISELDVLLNFLDKFQHYPKMRALLDDTGITIDAKSFGTVRSVVLDRDTEDCCWQKRATTTIDVCVKRRNSIPERAFDCIAVKLCDDEPFIYCEPEINDC